MMFERFSREARAVVVGAQVEAAALAHGWIGTEHLLLGLLRDAASPTARLLARWEVDSGWARAEVERIVGRGEPDLDAGALATLGIDLDAIRARVEQTFGPGALARSRCRRGGLGSHVPFTPRAKKALELSLREALVLGDNHIGAQHVLLGLLRESDGLAAQILRSRGLDRGAVVDALAGRTG
jgi:ATP-dependent Clp protease ATP-binding subunit ClpA